MVTKKMLGLALTAGGLSAVIALLAIDWLGAGQFTGMGPLQRLALQAAGVITVVGLTLIPLGDRPA